MTKIKTFKEFYTELDGKTERGEIEEIMNRATIAILKVYLPYKAYEGMSAWRKADYVNAATDYTLEKIGLEEEDSKVLHEMVKEARAEDDTQSADEEAQPEEKIQEEITAMATKYAEIRGTIRVIKKGVTEIRKGIKMLEKQGQPHDGLLSVIEGAKDEYHRLRREGFLLWRKLLRVMSVSEIRRVCESYMARCEEEKRRHMRK